MGNREYGVLIKTVAELHHLVAMVDEHNRQNAARVDTGSEDLYWGKAIINRRKLYICLHSGGGDAEYWMKQYMREHGFALKVFWPFEKPNWWGEAPVVEASKFSSTDKIDAELRDEVYMLLYSSE